MLKFIRRRLLQLAPVLLGVSVLVFFGMHLIPGDVAQLLLGDKGTEADLQRIRHQLGLDRPVYVQYVRFLAGVLRGDFGISIRTRQPVMWEIGQALPVTVQLSLAALAFAVVVGLLIGVLAARYPRSALDTGSMVGVL
ncbi:MAG: ABC transporter permease, partial [Bacillati bacterium ANGP1]